MSAASVMDMTSSSSPSNTPAPQSNASCIAPEVLLHIAEQQALVVEADALLMQERWTWVRELIENVSHSATCSEAKLLFVRLVNADTLDAMDAVLSDLEAWRCDLEAKASRGENKRRRLPRELKELSRTLFLLGADKQLDLMRTAAEAQP